ncbi:uncharacterized protein LOC132497934 [Mesoplodon densirostris]|uniref:uncharacterized protein LOC132497934 n=1 Tax=Mesoplodon densirostris TaxID=48708 RepID=UPI0028DC1111|nr:uncharacterized protein LOC132497934 [Mesoplodon densirostris]
MRPEGECSERPGRGGDGGFSTPGTAGAGPRVSSLASRAGRHTRPAGVGVAAAASLSSGCHRLASAPHPASAAAAAATTAPGERVPKAPARPTWSSPRERYGVPEGTSWSRARTCALQGRSRKMQGFALFMLTECLDALRYGARARLSATLTHIRTSALRSLVGRVLLLLRTARLTVLPQRTACVGVRSARRGDPGNLPRALKDSVLLFSICG